MGNLMMDSGNGANMVAQNDLNLPEEMSDLHIAHQSTDEQIAEAIRISMRDIPSPLDGVMSTPQGEETGDRYQTILNHKEPTCNDDVRRFLSDLRGLLQHEPSFLKAQRPLSSLLREETTLKWDDAERDADALIQNNIKQLGGVVRLQSTKRNGKVYEACPSQDFVDRMDRRIDDLVLTAYERNSFTTSLAQQKKSEGSSGCWRLIHVMWRRWTLTFKKISTEYKRTSNPRTKSLN